jgi:hypothetical protein
MAFCCRGDFFEVLALRIGGELLEALKLFWLMLRLISLALPVSSGNREGQL